MMTIINFQMTSSLPVNYVIDILFTTFLAVIPVKVVYDIFKRGFKV